MSQTSHQAHPTEHPERHEHSDVRPRPLLTFAIVVIVLAVIFHVGLYFLYGLYSILPAEKRKQLPQSAVPVVINVPPPRIQGIPSFNPNLPSTDMQRLSEAYEKALNSSGPTGQPGFARIPIDRAMQSLLQHGLPATQSTSTQPTTTPR